MTFSFRKMHGLGNDFVVIDTRSGGAAPSTDQIKAMADRRTGIGCDQLIVLALPERDDVDVVMKIHNPDGSEAGACGNATRCIAALVMRETGREEVAIETVSGVLAARGLDDGRVTVDMGPARLKAAEIPLSLECDTLHVPLSLGPLSDPVAVSMGNPHCVFFVPSAQAIELEIWGPQVETHPLFPARTNVEVVEVLAKDRLVMRVWERGAGITQACGSGACAVLVAACRRGLSARKATVLQPGGALEIEWTEDNRVLMTGGWAESFTGVWPA